MSARLGSRSAFALVALTGFLLVFGSTVRVHGAGLSCPDWPLCFGRVVPEYEFRVYLEFGHRVIAGAETLGFLWVGRKLSRNGVFARSRATLAIYLLAVAALLTQIVLGGLTVLHLLAEWTVASHLLVGNTFCALLLLLALSLRELEAARVRTALSGVGRSVALGMVALVPVQLVVGGLVSSSNAGLACGTWPTCDGVHWFPTLSGFVGLQVAHRAVAYTIAGLALANVAVNGRNPTLRPAVLTVLGVVCAQIAVGVANVLLRLPVEVTLLHSAGAASLMLASTWLAAEAWRSPVAVDAASPLRPGTVVA